MTTISQTIVIIIMHEYVVNENIKVFDAIILAFEI
jgi:hypothetical protein